jgi:hypothetical protein
MTFSSQWWLEGVCLAVAVQAVGCVPSGPPPVVPAVEARRALFAELRPSTLANCSLKRYGVLHDGGYLMCENLMDGAQAAYSYGIDGRDDWGCDVSRQLGTAVHEYDCFNLSRPACSRGSFVFHEECVGGEPTTIEGRPYSTLADHIARNGDSGKRLIMKMDVEGSEWATLLAVPESLLDLVDQLAIEFHHTDDPRFVEVVKKLNRVFRVAHFHANNNACDERLAPFTSWANEVLFVNRRLAVVASDTVPPLPHALDSRNTTARRDCQPRF